MPDAILLEIFVFLKPQKERQIWLRHMKTISPFLRFPVVTGLTGNEFSLKVRLQFYQHGGRYERCSFIDRPNCHFIVVVACRCIAGILHGTRQPTQASQKYEFSSISKRQEGEHFLVRAGENVVVKLI